MGVRKDLFTDSDLFSGETGIKDFYFLNYIYSYNTLRAETQCLICSTMSYCTQTY